nr:MAG TPA: hypothetical protein [Caudoviricetes sp.]
MKETPQPCRLRGIFLCKNSAANPPIFYKTVSQCSLSF